MGRIYSPLAIANSFLEIAKSRGEGISPMKLQKLVFFAHAWNLVYNDEALIDEPILAWRFGPVVESVYHTFKQYGARDIQYPGLAMNPDWSPFFDTEEQEYVIPRLDPSKAQDSDKLSMLKHLWELYGHMSGQQLSDLTHKEHTPWGQTAQDHKYGSARDFRLDNELIRRCMRNEIFGEQSEAV